MERTEHTKPRKLGKAQGQKFRDVITASIAKLLLSKVGFQHYARDTIYISLDHVTMSQQIRIIHQFDFDRITLWGAL